MILTKNCSNRKRASPHSDSFGKLIVLKWEMFLGNIPFVSSRYLHVSGYAPVLNREVFADVEKPDATIQSISLLDNGAGKSILYCIIPCVVGFCV